MTSPRRRCGQRGAAGVALGATLLVALAVLAAMRVRRVRARGPPDRRSCASPRAAAWRG
jgi:hypothetical protein